MREDLEKAKKEREQKQQELENQRIDNLVKMFVEYYISKLGIVTLVGFCKHAEISESFFKNRFGSVKEIYDLARKQYPESFTDIAVENFTNDDCQNEIKEVIKKNNRFIITTAVTGCAVDENALKSVKNYCKINKAELLIVVCSDPANSMGGYGTIDRLLKDEHIIMDDTELNSNFFICAIKTTAKQINPTTGLSRIQKEGSFVFASPKQMLKMESISNTKLPHALMTTGAITFPNYKSEKYGSGRTDYIADSDHKMGAFVVEIQDEQVFHPRPIQFDENGSFCDFGKEYTGTTCKEVAPAAMIPGDWHSGETDPKVVKAIKELAIKLKPKRIILHDVFNGMSINPYEKDNSTLKCIRAEAGKLDIKEELAGVAKDLNMLAKLTDEVVVVKSNHDDFLNRYLSAGHFHNDSSNLRIGLELSIAILDKKDPLQVGVNESGVRMETNIKWLRRDEDFKIAGIECGAHGDKGPNGSRGNLASMEKSYVKSVTGHSHAPGILRDAWAVGTSSYLQLVYNVGPSSWLQTLCIIYENGQRQLINIIDGKYTIK